MGARDVEESGVIWVKANASHRAREKKNTVRTDREVHTTFSSTTVA
jgi:hypothetical protein